MACMVESLGMSLPGNAAIPAVDARRYTLAQLTGRRIVEMVKEDLCISKILTQPAFENAILANAAIGGSTNAVLHLMAIAREAEVEWTLADFDRLGARVPHLADLKPGGRFVMNDLHKEGGTPAVLKALLEAAGLPAA